MCCDNECCFHFHKVKWDHKVKWGRSYQQGCITRAKSVKKGQSLKKQPTCFAHLVFIRAPNNKQHDETSLIKEQKPTGGNHMTLIMIYQCETNNRVMLIYCFSYQKNRCKSLKGSRQIQILYHIHFTRHKSSYSRSHNERKQKQAFITHLRPKWLTYSQIITQGSKHIVD